MPRLALVLIFALPLISGCRTIGLFAPSEYENLESAEEHSRQGEYDQAIAAYRKHMRYRLGLSDRPEWENPYLYLLMIGDLQLRQEKPDEARITYELAEKNKVDPALVSDRFRYLASWYEQKGDIDTALKILTTYRNRDELLFDVMRDRLAKELVRKELEATPAPIVSPTATVASNKSVGTP